MRWIVMPVLLLILPILVIAQDSETFIVTIDGDNRGSVDYIIEDDFSYIRIEAIVDDLDSFDPVVWVVDSANHLLAYNDNHVDSSNARIENLGLQAGRYTIWLDSFNGVSEGEVSLTITHVDPFQQVIESSEQNQVLTVTLPEDTTYRYLIDLNAGDIISIRVRDISGTLDPYLGIVDESGVLLIANDDHQSPDLSLDVLDSLISEWHVPSDGVFVLEVRDFLGHSGEFEISITIISE